MNLEKNVGKQDSTIRFAAGIALIVLGLLTGLWWLDIIGIILLATAYFGTCLAYLPLGINTAKESTSESNSE